MKKVLHLILKETNIYIEEAIELLQEIAKAHPRLQLVSGSKCGLVTRIDVHAVGVRPIQDELVVELESSHTPCWNDKAFVRTKS